MSQRDDVLRMLRDAGPAGVHTTDLRRAYVGNPSQRVADLEERGYIISHERERSPYGTSMGTRYRLVRELHASPDRGVNGAADASSSSASAAPTPSNSSDSPLGGDPVSGESPDRLFDTTPTFDDLFPTAYREDAA